MRVVPLANRSVKRLWPPGLKNPPNPLNSISDEVKATSWSLALP
jgi:hypothetical protein